jgi:large subunit ribosomal protein L4
MAIASKIIDNELTVIDDLSFAKPATKEMATVLKALKLEGVRTLIATESLDQNVYKSARNIQRVSVSPVSDLNALAVLTPARMLVTRKALDAIKQRVAGNGASATESA